MQRVCSSVSVGIPEAARHLIWDVFFARGGRGVDFDTHLPWHADAFTRTVHLSVDAEAAVAAAVVRPARQDGAALIGYVCVDGAMRGRGLGRELIAAVNSVVDAAGYATALLWTTKPEIYSGKGYVATGRDEYLQVRRLKPLSRLRTRPVRSHWPAPENRAGLPPFATEAYRLQDDRVAAIVACGPRGATVLDWSGDPADIANLMASDGHDEWGVNVPAGSGFAAALSLAYFATETRPGAVTMVRRTDPLFKPAYVAVADRI